MDDSVDQASSLDLWCVARWTFLGVNMVFVSGWVYFLLLGTEVHTPWVAWAARSLITLQLMIGVLSLYTAYRRRLVLENQVAIVGEAWAYFLMAILCGFTLALPLVPS